MRLVATTLLLCAAAILTAQAQTTGNTGDVTSAERARLANQRIQADMEMRAREEQRRLEEEQARLQAEEAAAQETAVNAQNPTPPATGGSRSQDMSRTLEQIRTLGELKDAGYVSEEEFRKIKQRILDDQL